MKKQLLVILMVLLCAHSYSQISFEKAYYINNSNEKVDCLIKNNDWKNNPTEFEFILTENSSPQKASIKTIKEFGIYNISKYSRYSVGIDRSSNIVSEMSHVKKNILQEEELFLKVLVEGKASLYAYEDGNLKRFFYSKDDSKVEQLTYKEYLNTENEIGTNNIYKQQLWNSLRCTSLNKNKFENLNYKKNELVNLFVEYNKCNNQEYTNFEKKIKKDLFNLNIRPGINYSSLSTRNSPPSSRETDFDNELAFRFGIEAEFILPFNKNKWAIIIEPTYQYFKSEQELTNQTAKADYTSVELPIGVRHYFFLNENSKIFINGSFLFDFSSNSHINFDFGSNLEIKTRNNLAFGVGYKHNNKYSLELRYQTNRDVLDSYSKWNSEYKTLSVIFGYSLF